MSEVSSVEYFFELFLPVNYSFARAGCYLRQSMVSDDGGVVDSAQVACPRAHGADVQAEVFLVRRRAEREGVVLAAAQHRTRDAYPLARLVLEVGRPLDVDGSHI